MSSVLSISVSQELKRRSSKQPEWIGVRPDGAPCHLNDDIWYLSDLLAGASRSSLTINWAYKANEYPSKKQFRYWSEIAKLTSALCMDSDKTILGRTSSLSNYAREIRALCFWLSAERGCSGLNVVTRNDIAAYEESIAESQLKISTCVSKLQTIRLFWIFRDELGGGLKFVPYMRPGSLNGTAKRIGCSDGHTSTFKPESLFKLLDTALRIVAQSDGLIGDLNIYLNLKDNSEGNLARVFVKHTGYSANVFLSRLRIAYGAALVVLFTLLGDRKHQVAALTLSDTQALLDGELEELIGTVRKGSPTVAGHQTRNAACPEVRKALSLIVALTFETRKLYSGDRLLISLPVAPGSNFKCGIELGSRRIYSLLDNFSKEAGSTEKVLPHMFRRAFSMIWTWRFEIGDLYWLSQLLNHSRPEYAKRYTEDEDVLEFLPEIQQGYAVDILQKAIVGSDRIVGGASKSMRRYSRLLLSKVTVINAEVVGDFARSLINSHGYTLMAFADGYCFSSERRGARAKCSLDGCWPNYANRSELTCTDCSNFGVRSQNKEVWVERKKNHQIVYDSSDCEIVCRAAEEGVNNAAKVIRWIDEGLETNE